MDINSELGVKVETMEVLIIPMEDIYADEGFNSRGKIAPIDVAELGASIKEKGLLQPVLVQRLTDEEKKRYGTSCTFRLLAGFRRHMAHLLIVRSPTIQACVLDKHLSETDAFFLNLAENLDRQDLKITQEAKAVMRLLSHGLTEALIAKRLGKSVGWVNIRTMLLRMPPEIQLEAELGTLSQMQIRELFTIFKTGGREQVLKAARVLKLAREKGKEATLKTVTSKNLDKKRIRNKGEIFSMMEVIQKSIGNNIATRGMAWCAGEISTTEFIEALEDFDPSFTFIPDEESGFEAVSV